MTNLNIIEIELTDHRRKQIPLGNVKRLNDTLGNYHVILHSGVSYDVTRNSFKHISDAKEEKELSEKM